MVQNEALDSDIRGFFYALFWRLNRSRINDRWLKRLLLWTNKTHIFKWDVGNFPYASKSHTICPRIGLKRYVLTFVNDVNTIKGYGDPRPLPLEREIEIMILYIFFLHKFNIKGLGVSATLVCIG